MQPLCDTPTFSVVRAKCDIIINNLQSHWSLPHSKDRIIPYLVTRLILGGQRQYKAVSSLAHRLSYAGPGNGGYEVRAVVS